MALLVGHMADRLKVWKMVLVLHVSLMVSLIVWVSYCTTGNDIYSASEQEPMGMTVGFIMTSFFSSSLFGLN